MTETAVGWFFDGVIQFRRRSRISFASTMEKSLKQCSVTVGLHSVYFWAILIKTAWAYISPYHSITL